MRQEVEVWSWELSWVRSMAPRMPGGFCLAIALVLFAATSSASAVGPCPNEPFRIGPSAKLPDCRAYELVTPRKVNGAPEAGFGNSNFENNLFDSPPTTAGGESYLFSLHFASLPDSEGNGINNEYHAVRTPGGWVSSLASPTGSEAVELSTGGVSADHGYKVFSLNSARGGSLAVCGECGFMNYLRYPDGSFHLLGEGTVPVDPDTDGFPNGLLDDLDAEPRWIGQGESHQIFSSDVPLVPGAAATVSKVYDRTPTGLHLVTRLPDGTPLDVSAFFAGSSRDGSTVLFRTGDGRLFARVDNAESIEIANASSDVLEGGVSSDGSRAFYVVDGEIFAYDLKAKATLPVVTTGDAILTLISADGSHAYFISETPINGEGVSGSPNLYVWDGSSIKFIGTVTPGDLAHNFEQPGESFLGLAQWTRGHGIENRPPAAQASNLLDTARTTPDGEVFVFESSAQLTLSPNEGHGVIYRYEAQSENIECVSCPADGTPATSDSELADVGEPGSATFLGLSTYLEIPNVSMDGQQVVFGTADSLLPQDVNGADDVYEWRAGQLNMISTGQDSQPSQLVGVTPSGNDVFIRTGDVLVGKGQEAGALAIYDARVGGGLASQQAERVVQCVGEGCLGEPPTPPSLSAPASATFHGKGNVKRGCRRTHRKRHAKRHGHGTHKKASAAKRKPHRPACRHASRRPAR